MKKIAKTLIDTKILDRALAVGVLCEAAFVIAAHYRPFLGLHFGLFACMMIAGTAALLYARDLARGYVIGALGGLVIGAACGIATVWPVISSVIEGNCLEKSAFTRKDRAEPALRLVPAR